MQIQGQTGCIGHLRGDFDRNGNGFFTSWDDHREQWKTNEFKAELDDVINALRSDEYGLLKNRSAMGRYAAQYPESRFQGNYCTEYGFRAETEKHAFLIRCNPIPGDYNFYCYCYVKEWLDQHISKAEKGIRFINSRYDELFRIADGEKIKIKYSDGEEQKRACRYIDDYHMEVGSNLYHICQFAEVMERNGASFRPAKKADWLVYPCEWEGNLEVALQINRYMNGNIYVGLDSYEAGYPEPYSNVTININKRIPDYCGYLDTNHFPHVEKFVTENRLGEFTGLKERSGCCEYPLYLFEPERLRELCPEGLEIYENEKGLSRKNEKNHRSR